MNEVYYKVLIDDSDDALKLPIVCLQSFDDSDYDETVLVKNFKV